MLQAFQSQRFELKYLVDPSLTLEMREFLRTYLELDDYGVGQEDLAYPVHSVYMDSDGLDTYHDTLNGTKNRFKLRLRYYDDRPDTPVFFEVKGRVDNCILKQRCGVRREAISLVMAGQLPDQSQLISKDPRHLAAIQRFNRLLLKLNAKPKAHNSYLREAWVSPYDNSVRVTFDRNVRIEPYFKTDAPVTFIHPVNIFADSVILELKFTNRFPDWFKVLVRAFNLPWTAAAKYAGGVLIMGEHFFHDGEKGLDWQRHLPHELMPDASEPLLRGTPIETEAFYE